MYKPEPSVSSFGACQVDGWVQSWLQCRPFNPSESGFDRVWTGCRRWQALVRSPHWRLMALIIRVFVIDRPGVFVPLLEQRR